MVPAKPWDQERTNQRQSLGRDVDSVLNESLLALNLLTERVKSSLHQLKLIA